jgi:hypothetical protein
MEEKKRNDYFMFFLLDEKEPKNQENMTLYRASKLTFPTPVRHIFGARPN